MEPDRVAEGRFLPRAPAGIRGGENGQLQPARVNPMQPFAEDLEFRIDPFYGQGHSILLGFRDGETTVCAVVIPKQGGKTGAARGLRELADRIDSA